MSMNFSEYNDVCLMIIKYRCIYKILNKYWHLFAWHNESNGQGVSGDGITK